MQSAIVFLGTGSGSLVRAKQTRSTGGIVIIEEGNQFMLDPGPGAVVKAKEAGINLRQNLALFVSHSHLGHANDINVVLDAMTYSGLDRQGILVVSKSLVQPSDYLTPALYPNFKNYVERCIILEPKQKLAINNIEVRALECIHSDPNTIGFKFLTSNFVLSYTSDTSYHKDLIEQYKNSDILVLNVVSPEKSEHNLCVDDAVKIIKEVNPALAIITHFNNKMIDADPIYIAREIQKLTNVQTIAAKDGLVIDPASYAARSKQKLLQGY